MTKDVKNLLSTPPLAPINNIEYLNNQPLFENRREREWLTTKEAAHFLAVSPNALRIMVHRDQIQTYRLGRRLRFRLKDCQALFLKKGA